MFTGRPLDTTKEADLVQLEIYRRMRPEQRLQIGLQLSRLVRKSLEQGVRMRHPEYAPEQVRLAVIRLILPEELFHAAYPEGRDIVP